MTAQARLPSYSTMPDRDTIDSKMRHKDPSAAAAMRRLALLVDGMSRAAIIPFGPRLIHRLSFQKDFFGAAADIDAASWSQVAFPFAIVIGVYALGRALGTSSLIRFPLSQTMLVHHVARLGGVSLALHVYTFGAGLSSVRWLVFIRFCSAALAGFLCEITNTPLPEDNNLIAAQANHSDDARMEEGLLSDNDLNEQALRKRERAGYMDLTPGTAKIYMTGFAFSILSGGLLYRHASVSTGLQALTGGYPFTLSPLFFVAICLGAEFVLRCVFAYSSEGKAASYVAGGQGGPMTRLVKSVVNRRVRISAAPPRSRETSYLEFADYLDDDQIEFFDPLSFSRHPDFQLQPPVFSTPNRNRLDSTRSEASASEFFDCNSAIGDEIIDLDADPFTGESAVSAGRGASETEVAMYTNGKSEYPDGSPAFIPQGDCVSIVPANYMAFCNGNHNKARKMWNATQKWRFEKNVWRIHTLPHSFFADIKAAYPHFIHGHSKQGFAIIYEQPGRMNLKELFRNGCEISEMVKHYMFLMEYVANCVGTREEIRSRTTDGFSSYNSSSWGTMVVMDVKGASLTSLSGDVVKYLKQAGDINSAHYPMNMKRAFLVNSPFWLAGAWSGIKGILPESVQVDILSASKSIAGLREFIDDDQIPKEYGGSSPYPLGHHPYEIGLADLVAKADAGKDIDLAQHVKRENLRNRRVESAPEPVYSFNHNEQRWVKDQTIPPHEPSGSTRDDVISTVMNSGSWRTELVKSPMKSPSFQPLRRRTMSVERQRSEGFPMTIVEELPETNLMQALDELTQGEGDVLVIVSMIYIFWCAVQGAIEIAVPLWVLSPAILGGLGYSPSRSGIAMFSASVVLLWLMRTKVAQIVSQIPNKAPMRAFRVGVGAQSVLLALLPLVPTHVTTVSRADSVLIMTSTIIILSCMALASMLGQSAAGILHRVAAESFARQPTGSATWLSRMYRAELLSSDCESGKLTSYLRVLGEILGIIVVAPLYYWSTLRERPAPFDGSCCFFLASLLTFVLYVSSFSLHLNVVGKFTPHPKDGCSDVDTRKCCSFVGEVFTVSVGDMASLFEEANWSTSPLLGYSRVQVTDRFAEASTIMERGQCPFGVKSI